MVGSSALPKRQDIVHIAHRFGAVGGCWHTRNERCTGYLKGGINNCMLTVHGSINNMNGRVGWQLKTKVRIWCMPQHMATKHFCHKFCKLWMHLVLLYDVTMLYQAQGA